MNGELMKVINRLADRLVRIVIPEAEATAVTCGQKCFCYQHHIYAWSCLNHGCVFTGQTC